MLDSTWEEKYAQQLKISHGPKATMGARLKLLRYERKESIREVAAKTGVSTTALYKWEDDTNLPRVYELVVMAEYYGETLDYIVLGK